MISGDVKAILFCLPIFLYMNGFVYSQEEFNEPAYACFDIASKYAERGYADSAIFFFQRASSLYVNNKDIHNYYECIFALAHNYFRKMEYDSCSFYLNKLQNSGFTGEIAFLKSSLLIHEDKLNDAFIKLTQAEEKAMEMRDTLLLASIYYNFGKYYYYSNDKESALKYYQKALNLHIQKKVINIETTLFLENIAFLFKDGAIYQRALEYLDYSYIIKRFILRVPHEQYIVLYINRGVVLRSLLRTDEAINSYLEAEEILSTVSFPKQYNFMVLNGLGITYGKYDKHELALSYFNRALDLAFEMNEKGLISDTYQCMAYSYADMKDYEKALEYYQKGFLIKQALGQKNHEFLYRQIAKVYNKMGDSRNADRFFQMAIENIVKNQGQESRQLLFTYLDYGEFLLQEKQYLQALRYFNISYKLSIQYYGENHYYTSRSLLRTGDYFLLLGETETALDYYHQSVMAFFPEYISIDYLSVPGEENLPPYEYAAECLGKKANALIKLGFEKKDGDRYFKAAMGNYTIALKVIDLLKYEYKDLNFGLLLAEDFKPIFEEAANSACEVYNKTLDNYYLQKAWEFSEGNKATLIRAMYSENEAKQVAGVPPDIQHRQKKLQKDILEIRNLIETEQTKQQPDKQKITHWNNKLLSSFNSLDSITSFLKSDYPMYFDLKYNTDIIGIVDVRNMIDENQVVIEYFLTAQSLITFVVTHDSAQVYKQIVDSSFYSLVNDYCQYFRDIHPDYTIEGFKDYVATAHKLYSKLIEPFEKITYGKSLIIIPDDVLGLVPFEALVVNPGNFERVDYKGVAYLIKQNPVLYEYSASFIEQEKTNRKRRPRVLAMVPRYDSVMIDEVMKDTREATYLTPLIGAMNEVEGISCFYKTNKILNKEASETMLLKLAPQYSILHIAGHTLINDENPMFSKLVLTMQEDSLADNLLNTYELYNHTLGSDMVVLSGCNTGIGKLRKGEGMISLARGFIFAGCRSIVMTLWSVSDKSSAELISNFYSSLSDGIEKDKALQQAKISYLQSADPLKAHPYYWAGYICIGDNEPIPAGWLIQWKMLAIMGGIISLTLLIFIRRKRRKIVQTKK